MLSALGHHVQVLLIIVLVAAGFPIGVGLQVTAATSAYGCTLDPMKPNEPDNQLVAKAQYRCSTAMPGRTIRTELQQRKADGAYYTVPRSIVVRSVSDVTDNQWHGADSDRVRCQKVSGTRRFKSIIMITDGAGTVTEVASNSEEYNRDCADAGEATRVGLVFASSRIEDCAIATEVLTDPNAEFTDPEVLASDANVRPCGEDGVVTESLITIQADAEWNLAVEGMTTGLPSGPSPRQGTEGAVIIPLTGNESQDLAAVTAKEEEIGNLFVPEDDDAAQAQRLAEVGAEQVGPCQQGRIGDRGSTVLRKRNRSGRVLIFSTVRYKRLTCSIWQITDVQTFLKRATREVRLDSAEYFKARPPGSIDSPFAVEFHILHHDYNCTLMQPQQHIGWSAEDKWEILPNRLFKIGAQLQSLEPIFQDPWCITNGGTHLVGRQRLHADSR